MPEKISVFLVDDHKIFVRGVSGLLSPEPGLEIMGFASSGQETLDLIQDRQPDVILTDVQMPEMDGIELTRKVKDRFPLIRIIGLSMIDSPGVIKELIDAGADGYLLKDIEKDELVKAIYQVFEGNTYYSGSIARSFMESLSNKDMLTKREKEIIRLIAQENTNIQIADKLYISEHTVEAHRKNIFRKTKAKSIVGLIKYAYDNKLL
jgi:two-component system nitrate/nitrite response regulator NarL